MPGPTSRLKRTARKWQSPDSNQAVWVPSQEFARWTTPPVGLRACQMLRPDSDGKDGSGAVQEGSEKLGKPGTVTQTRPSVRPLETWECDTPKEKRNKTDRQTDR